MKTLFKSVLLFAAATLAFSSCEKNNELDTLVPEASDETISISATAIAPEQTRVEVSKKDGGGYNVEWSEEGETFRVVEYAFKSAEGDAPNYQATSKNDDIAYSKQDDGSAYFEFGLKKLDSEYVKFDYFAIYPFPVPAGSTTAQGNANYFHAYIPVNQTQTGNMVDPSAIVMVGSAKDIEAQGAPLTFNFKYITGFGKMTVKGVELEEGQKIEKVTFTVSDSSANGSNAGNGKIAGLYMYKPYSDGNYFSATAQANSNTITVDLSGYEGELDVENGFDVWFGIAPTSNISAFSVAVYAEGEEPIASKDVVIANADRYLAFESGVVSNFTVSLTKPESSTTSVKDIYEKGAGVYTVENAVVVSVNKQGYVFSDTSGEFIQVYTGAETGLKLGDKGTIKGTVETRPEGNGAFFQFAKGTTFEKSSNETPNLETPEEYDGAKLDAYAKLNGAELRPVYVTFTGNLAISGNYYNITVEGATAQGSISYPTTDLSTYNGKDIKVTGFLIGYSSSGKFVNISLNDIEAVGGTVEPEEPEGVVVTLPYTLDTTLEANKGSNSDYSKSGTVTVDEIVWYAEGNLTMKPWRIGGKSLTTGTDRVVKTQTAMNADVKAIEITHGEASSITVNSMKVVVSKKADFSNPVSTFEPKFQANATITITKPDEVDWNGCYYQIVYNVSVSGGSNRFIEFKSVTFTDGTSGGGDDRTRAA